VKGFGLCSFELGGKIKEVKLDEAVFAR